MQYKYVCKADAATHYDAAGVSALALPLDADFPDVRANGIKFYRYNLKAAAAMSIRRFRATRSSC